MAENTQFPGTEMEVIEKYPLSRRLDFPSFGDVCKTTFAKGVITEFKELPEDQRELLQWADYTPSTWGPYVPQKWEDGENLDIAVESMVKVKIEGSDESEFIPIFYHPKAKYWDDEDPRLSEPILSTDFDVEQGCHKLAWQSFRVDDEVAVMLKEGVPVAVVGFADGVPRVGEAIFQMEYDTIDGSSKTYQWQPGLRGEPSNEGKGQPLDPPLDLGLKQEAEIIYDTGAKEQEYVETQAYLEEPWNDGNGGDNILVNYSNTYTTTKQFREYFFTIGPIAYILQILQLKQHIVNTSDGEGLDVVRYSPPYHAIINYNSDAWHFITRFSIWSKLYSKKVKEDAIALGETHSSEKLFVEPAEDVFNLNADWVQRYFCKSVASGDGHSMSDYDVGIKPPNPDFLLPEWGGPSWPDDQRGPPWEGWIFQPDWSVRMGISNLINADSTDRDQIDGSTLKIFTRPHTKEELQAAGMWPAA